MAQFKSEDEVRQIIEDLLTGVREIGEAEELINETVTTYIGNKKAQKRIEEDILKAKKQEIRALKESEKILGKISGWWDNVNDTIQETFSGGKLKKASAEFMGTISAGFNDMKEQAGGMGNAVGVLANVSLKGMKLAGVGAITTILAVGWQLLSQFNKIDEALVSVIETSGVMDNTLGNTLVEATEHASILGGDISIAADAANELFKQLSPSLNLTSKLVGNVASVSERFGIGIENATSLARIISERTNESIGKAGERTEGFIESLGRLGPAVVTNLVESYDAVVNSFGIGLESLKQQSLEATQLGISLEDAAKASEGLLDIGSSIQSQFKASALLGQDLNLQRARQLAFEGDIVGANEEILNQVQQLGDLSQFNTFQRQALAEATGKTVSELERELQIRRQIGSVGRIQEATRREALTRYEAISRRISGAFFRIISDPQIQDLIDSIAEGIIGFLEGPGFKNFVGAIDRFVTNIAQLHRSDVSFNPLGLIGWGDLFQGAGVNRGTGNIQSLNDGIITNKGEVVSTNPRDYIIATQNPAQMVEGSGGVDKQTMQEIRGLLKYLKENGVKAGDTYLDGRKVSKQLAMSGR